MKPLILIFFLIGITSCVQNEPADSMPESAQNSTEIIDSLIEKIELQPKPIMDSNIILFKNQFKFNFPQKVDFGWRYIESNYEENDQETKGTPYNEKYNLEQTAFFDMNGKPFSREISGYAHSYKRINSDSLLFLTMVHGEISQGFILYLTNNKLKVLKKEMIASNGGDEGSWFYKFGSFDQGFNYYAYEEVEGFAKDTLEMMIDTLWLRKTK